MLQDALQHMLMRLGWFESKQVIAMRAYPRHALENRIREELRRVLASMLICTFSTSQNCTLFTGG